MRRLRAAWRWLLLDPRPRAFPALISWIAEASLFRKRREPGVELHPRELRAHVDVIFRGNRLGIGEGTGRHVDLVGEVTRLERKRRPAAGTERAHGVVRRPKPRRLTRHEFETHSRHGKPRNEWRPAHAPANRTVTVRLVRSRAERSIPDESAETAAFAHRRTLPRRAPSRFVHFRGERVMSRMKRAMAARVPRAPSPTHNVLFHEGFSVSRGLHQISSHPAWSP
jgi:hypothetical protein